MKPFIKWVGGKGQLLPEITKRLPNSFTRYFEPFVGGGALLFDLECQRAIFSDTNTELINTYQVIKHFPTKFIELLDWHTEQHSEDHFLAVRGLDRLQGTWELMTPEQRAARFIYINKAGFNGLWRVNKQGQCNTSWGKRESVKLYEYNHLKRLADYLLKNAVDIYCQSYADTLHKTRAKDFVYLDPPYLPVEQASNFQGYTTLEFRFSQYAHLAGILEVKGKQGVNWMLSSSDHNFVRDLFSSSNIHEVQARRNVNCNGAERGAVTELLITNY